MKSIDSALLTDLYQLTMLQGYYEQGMDETAVFEFFVRDLPPERGFLLAAGLEQVLQYLEGLCFTREELDYLKETGRFSDAFLDSLAALRFTGDVHAMPEGTPFFANEPILRVVAPMPQAQLMESRVINLLHYQTLVASKAARCVLAAPGKLLVDFGMRRAHAGEAGLLAARASYLAGFDGSSTVLAAPAFGVPIYGTMAHSFVQAHDLEAAAFEHFAHAQPDNVVLLIDTYDTEAAAQKVVELAARLQGINIKAVRLDSGDLFDHARQVRAILDAGGLRQTRLFCSGNLDEYQLQAFIKNDVPMDGFGVGTLMDTSADVPYLDCAYKLQEYAGIARRKHSEGKETWPGRKQVYRRYAEDGVMSADIVTLEDDVQEGRPLIRPVMRDGRRVQPPPALSESRDYAQREFESLPGELKRLEEHRYRVEIATVLKQLAHDVDLQQH
ncbi:nicotinate phosphoribosyltransferase [Candidatus Tenderia electrophaga]|jgi:nicotinate phosphoribosyltransferase|uniref:Nicotinate phosphoribosyltransferase n=1 Tax=Candidatus Tenderia electrophaga TaxID=1748243 RepID=A0A0S2TCU0_9GAMM|nr:nicotinate phosphoribosyltransferase [Candidatus Tenderia electrophaga]